jgi:hypothetical protein
MGKTERSNAMNRTAIEQFPAEVQEQILGTLRAFDEVSITFYGGRYWVVSGHCLMGKYPADYKAYGVYYAKDIYTEDERIQNYIEGFHDYPHNYKGKRDYAMLRQMSEMRSNGAEAQIQLVNGTAVLVGA